jgi:RHS repeat-associated protein
LATRKVKTTATGVTKTFIYHYDLQGNLIAETHEDGKPIRDYLWADNTPLAQIKVRRTNQGVLKEQTLLYLHTDHLNTPRLATDDTQTVLWRWEGDAFGQIKPDKDPDEDDSNTNVRLRFPGQYQDGESGLYYNWNRYYDPRTGRYVTSDPIGIEGGPNSYLYASENPLRSADPRGLAVLNPDNYPISNKVFRALWKFNRYIGCDKDVVITGGNRPNDTLGYHRLNLAADIKVPGQSHLLTANQASRSGLFGGVGWYQEGYRDPSIKGSGPHVHVDLGPPNRRWGFDSNGIEYHRWFPPASRTPDEGKETEECRCSPGSS